MSRRTTRLAAAIEQRRAEVYPLDKLPAEHQARIADAVAQDSPPPRWIRVECGEIPSRAWIEWHWARGRFPGFGRRDDIPRAVRNAVIERDGYVCGICTLDVEPADVHLDHVIPYSKGGPHTIDNLRVTHSVCNMRKGAKFDGS